ncbi:MAG: hypothetical protein IJ663_06135 [Spirochaetales bacterium]|nr:hypothetical protein [Spirochaetales bacterium]
MKRGLLFTIISILVVLLASCATAYKKKTTTVQIVYDSKADYAAQVEFAIGDILEACAGNNVGVVSDNAEYAIIFKGINRELGEQAYSIDVSDRTINISGGDAVGLMYGGLDISEQIAVIRGMDGIKSLSVSPYIKERGFKYHIPLDVRCPCQPSIGDSGVKNIVNVWDMDFWHELLDSMARGRFNVLSLANNDPFASMVKVDKYPDIALDDVWAPTIPYDNSYKGSLEDAVREEHWQEGNYKVIKKMTIDEKIAFWQSVMEYGEKRGVSFYLGLGHFYLFAEHGKYGITGDVNNAVTQDYYRESVKALIKTYPLLKGIEIGDGENMGWSNTDDAALVRWQWLHDAYVPAINEALAETPEREFSLTGRENAYPELFIDLNCTLLKSGNYTSVHMYATSKPDASISVIESLKENEEAVKLIFRNEDCFDMRWGDYDFMREFVDNMPTGRMLGYTTGSAGYCYERDYSSTDPEFQGQLYFDKHWVNYMLLGHLTYNKDLDYEYFAGLFKAHLENMADSDLLWETTCTAGKIIPLVQKQYFSGNSDYTWFVAASWSHPLVNGYIGVKRFMRSTNVYPGGGCISIEDYCLKTVAGEEIDKDLETPLDTAAKLREYGESVLKNVAQIRKEVKKRKNASEGERDFWALLDDDEAMAYLALFYAEKFLGSVDLRMYNETKDASYQDSSIRHLSESYEHWTKHAAIISANYVPQHLARLGDFNINEITEEVFADIEFAKTWKPRELPRSYNPPTRGNYFSGK